MRTKAIKLRIEAAETAPLNLAVNKIFLIKCHFSKTKSSGGIKTKTMKR